MVVEKEQQVLHFDLQVTESTVYHTGHSLSKGDLKAHPRVTRWVWCGFYIDETSKSTPTVTHFL